MRADGLIYLDHNATTPADRRVVEAMVPYFSQHFGNAASRQHGFGWEARDAVESARERAAGLIGADPREIVWTSGATEADNLAIRGVADWYRGKPGGPWHVITSAVEHRAVLDPCRRLEREGFEVTFLEPDETGRVAAEQVAEAVRPGHTVLVSIMWANNEVGTTNDVPAIGRVCKDHGVLFHTDATQYAGKLPIDVSDAGVDLLSFSGHKIHGPKGVGALYVRRRRPRVRLEPLFEGGGHERGMRSGTLNVPGIVGFGKACELCEAEMADERVRLGRLRDRLERHILASLDGCRVNGHPTHRLPQTSNLSFAGVSSDGVMLAMRNVAVSSASACTTASLEPSHVLHQMRVPDAMQHCSIRFSLGRGNTEEEIDHAAETAIASVGRLRGISPLCESAAGVVAEEA